MVHKTNNFFPNGAPYISLILLHFRLKISTKFCTLDSNKYSTVLISTSCDVVASSIFNNIFLFIGKKNILVKTTGHERPKNFVLFFVSNFRVRLIHVCDLSLIHTGVVIVSNEPSDATTTRINDGVFTPSNCVRQRHVSYDRPTKDFA